MGIGASLKEEQGRTLQGLGLGMKSRELLYNQIGKDLKIIQVWIELSLEGG